MRPAKRGTIQVRGSQLGDFDGIIALCERVYRGAPPWTKEQLASHLEVFPEGQFIAEETATGTVVGMASSLIVYWDDYDFKATWREWTDNGFFTNHDPENGKTLYGAEVMVDPAMQRRGVGKLLYAARRQLVIDLGLRRIRAGSRLRGYYRYQKTMTAEEYVQRVIQGKLKDPTLSFQLREGFEVLAVIEGYLPNDPESLSFAAIIEWLNPQVSSPRDEEGRDPRFRRLPLIGANSAGSVSAASG
jgi:GNAT superfamily N-acetyltransferase